MLKLNIFLLRTQNLCGDKPQDPMETERTGSITKLQKAMGHSSINVSLTYLRGLEIPELTEEDMPVV